MSMTMRELIDLLEEIIENEESVNDDTPVFVAHQPNWPLAERLSGVSTEEGRANVRRYYLEDGDEDEDDVEERDDRVFLVASAAGWNDHPYAPRSCWDSTEVDW